MNSLAEISLAVLALSALVGLATYLRNAIWREKDETKADATSQSALAADLKALKSQVDGLPTAALLATHDERLKAVEMRIADLPTSQQLATLTGSLEVLKAQMKGGFDTISAELRGSRDAQNRLQQQVDRFESHMLSGAVTSSAG